MDRWMDECTDVVKLHDNDEWRRRKKPQEM